MSSISENRGHHIALIPSAGMGHLAPFSRLAVALSDRGCDITFITVVPTVSAAESRQLDCLFSSFPRIRQHKIHLPPSEGSGDVGDPFFLRVKAICSSAHFLPTIIAESSTLISALVIDIFLVSDFIPVAASLGIPSYIYFSSSAMMLSFMAYFPTYATSKIVAGVRDIDIPGVRRVPKDSIMPQLHDPNLPFAIQFVENAQVLVKVDGILINTFQALEPEALTALQGGKLVAELPPVFAIGPLQPLPHDSSKQHRWLEEQPERSVVYVSFGSRTAMSSDQIKELGAGLEKSGCRFLWVLKTKKVDKEEEEELEELLGQTFLERVKTRGLVIKGWVEQEYILKHKAIGGFVSHCGWNSVSEAALYGVPILAWPRGGDQRINAEVVARSGLGMWAEEWSWEAEMVVVKGEEIGEKVRELMEDYRIRAKMARVREEAGKAAAAGGSSAKMLEEFIAKLKK